MRRIGHARPSQQLVREAPTARSPDGLIHGPLQTFSLICNPHLALLRVLGTSKNDTARAKAMPIERPTQGLAITGLPRILIGFAKTADALFCLPPVVPESFSKIVIEVKPYRRPTWALFGGVGCMAGGQYWAL